MRLSGCNICASHMKRESNYVTLVAKKRYISHFKEKFVYWHGNFFSRIFVRKMQLRFYTWRIPFCMNKLKGSCSIYLEPSVVRRACLNITGKISILVPQRWPKCPVHLLTSANLTHELLTLDQTHARLGVALHISMRIIAYEKYHIYRWILPALLNFSQCSIA